MEIDPAQLQMLKQKVASLAKRHKSIIENLKKDFKSSLERATKQSVVIKNKAKKTSEELIQEKRKNSVLSNQIDELKSIDSNAEVVRLKAELDQEMARANSFEQQLKTATTQQTQIRDEAYTEVKVKRLEEDLKTEISRSAQMRHDNEIRIEDLEKKLRKAQEASDETLQDKQEKIENLEKTLEEKELYASQIEEKSNEKNLILTDKNKLYKKELEQKSETITNNEETIKNNKQTIAKLEEEIINLNSKTEEITKEFNEQKEVRDKEIKKLSMIIHKYDIVTMGERVEDLKDRIVEIVKSNDQDILKSTLKETINLKKNLKRQIENLNEKTLNFHQDVDEFENRLRNRIFTN